MDLVVFNNRPQWRLSIASVVLIALLGLCGRSTSQPSGVSPQRIGCVVVNMTRTCFDFYNATMPWSDAWSLCQISGARMARLEIPEMDSLVGQFMDKYTENADDDVPVWIGGRELNSSAWNWTDGRPFVAQNTSTVLTIFNTLVNRYENCGLVSTLSESELTFNSSQCNKLRPFICQDQNFTSTTCEMDGSEGVAINNSCYVTFSSDPLSWFDARYKCQSLGADLAIFDELSTSDQSAIISILPNATLVWLGLRRYPWVWVTRFDLGAKTVVGVQEISYSGWDFGIPYAKGRSCLGMNGKSYGAGHGWANLKCDEPHPFICQQTTILTTTAPPTTAPPPTNATSDYYDYDSPYTMAPSSYKWNIVNIVVPIVIVVVVILVISFMIYCYFAQRRVGYVQQQ